MKLIFLDFDGVLNNSSSLFTGLLDNRNSGFLGIANPDPTCVKLLDYLIDKTNAYIIVSSSWRQGRTIDELKIVLRDEFGLKNWDKVLGKTKANDMGEVRGDQIEYYSKSNVSHYLILDDDSDMLESQKQNFVHTNFKYGLRLENMEDCFRILGNNFRDRLYDAD